MQSSMHFSAQAVYKHHRLGGLHCSCFIFSLFWKLEVQDRGAGLVQRFGWKFHTKFEATCLGLSFLGLRLSLLVIATIGVSPPHVAVARHWSNSCKTGSSPQVAPFFQVAAPLQSLPTLGFHSPVPLGHCLLLLLLLF